MKYLRHSACVVLVLSLFVVFGPTHSVSAASSPAPEGTAASCIGWTDHAANQSPGLQSFALRCHSSTAASMDATKQSLHAQSWKLGAFNWSYRVKLTDARGGGINTVWCQIATTDRQNGLLELSNGTTLPATDSSLPTNYFELFWTCNRTTDFQDWGRPIPFVSFGTSPLTNNVDSAVVHNNGSGVADIYGGSYASPNNTLIGMRIQSPDFYTAPLDDYGNTFQSSPCESLDVSHVELDETDGNGTAEPGDKVKVSVMSSLLTDFPEDFDWRNVYVSWTDSLTRGNSFDPARSDGPGRNHHDLLRSSFAPPISANSFQLECTYAGVTWYQTGDGQFWSVNSDLEPRDCLGVTVSNDWFPGEEINAAFYVVVEVTTPEVDRILVRGGPTGQQSATQSGGSGDTGIFPAAGNQYVTPGSYSMFFADLGPWPVSNLSVRCFDGYPVALDVIKPGLPDPKYVGGTDQRYQAFFTRPVGEPSYSTCFTGADIGLNPSSWVPGAASVFTCTVLKLFKPGEFQSGRFQDAYEESSFERLTEPALALVNAADGLATPRINDCAPTYNMPPPIPDLTLNMCDGPVRVLSIASFTMSTLLVGIWTARHTINTMEAMIDSNSKK